MCTTTLPILGVLFLVCLNLEIISLHSHWEVWQSLQEELRDIQTALMLWTSMILLQILGQDNIVSHKIDQLQQELYLEIWRSLQGDLMTNLKPPLLLLIFSALPALN